jgi:hypothetical protein
MTQPDPRAWLADALRTGHVATDLGGFEVGTLLAAADAEGVSALLHWRLHPSRGWNALPAHFTGALQRAARDEAARELFRSRQLLRVSQVLADAGIDALLLKGQALALWLYPQPHLRECSDIDLLLNGRDKALRAAEALTLLGYELAFVPRSSNLEMSSQLIVEGVVRSELDLHERLVNAPAYAGVFTFDELWDASVVLPAIGNGLRVLSPPHALAHSCLNRALDLQNDVPDALKLLYDIHLMLGRMDAAAWNDFISMAREKRLSGIALRSIADTVKVLETPVPRSSLEEMERLAARESLDWHRLDNWRYMQWQNLKALPTLGARLRWLAERLFPTRDHLRQLHGEGNWWRMMGRRIANAFAKWRRSSV